MFHRLGSLCRPLLDTIAGQNVDDADEVYLTAHTICVTTAFNTQYRHLISVTKLYINYNDTEMHLVEYI